MKKSIILLLIAFVFSNCEISPRKASASYGSPESYLSIDEKSQFGQPGYRKEYKIEAGMKYMFVYKDNYSDKTGYAVVSVNLTKDSLEVELLKKQLKK